MISARPCISDPCFRFFPSNRSFNVCPHAVCRSKLIRTILLFRGPSVCRTHTIKTLGRACFPSHLLSTTSNSLSNSQIMADAMDIDNDGPVGEKFDELSRMFSRFDFPGRPKLEGSPVENEYWSVVSNLFAL